MGELVLGLCIGFRVGSGCMLGPVHRKGIHARLYRQRAHPEVVSIFRQAPTRPGARPGPGQPVHKQQWRAMRIVCTLENILILSTNLILSFAAIRKTQSRYFASRIQTSRYRHSTVSEVGVFRTEHFRSVKH